MFNSRQPGTKTSTNKLCFTTLVTYWQ